MIKEILQKVILITLDGQAQRILHNFKHRISRMVTSAILGLIGLWLLGLAAFFLSIALAFYFNEVIGSTYQGFFVVGGLHFGIFLFLYIIVKLIRR